MRSLLLGFIVFFLLAQNTMALDINAINNIEVTTNEYKSIELTFAGNDELVLLSIYPQKPWITFDSSQVKISDGFGKSILYISPYPDTQTGIYKITLTARSLSGDIASEDIYISVSKGAIGIEKLIVSGELEPKGKVNLAFFVKNTKEVPISNLEISADIKHKDKTYHVDAFVDVIQPGETKIIEKSFYLEKYAEAGTYQVDAKLLYKGEKIDEKIRTFEVIQKPVIVESVEEDYLLFWTGKKIIVRNEGNSVTGNVVVDDDMPLISSLFYSGDKPSETQVGKYKWVITGLAPGEEAVISYNVNFLPLLIIVVAIFGILYIWSTTVKTIKIRKYVLQKKKIRKGTEFTVAVEVKNSMKTEKDVVIRDLVPSVFEIKDTQKLASSKKKRSYGTELVWKVKNLKPGEERLFTYKIVPIFGVNDKLKLPPASLEYKGRHKKIEKRSLTTAIGTIEPEPNVADVVR